MTSYTEPALLWLAGMVMGEVEAHDILHSAGITVVALQFMRVIGAHDIFYAASITVVVWHGNG